MGNGVLTAARSQERAARRRRADAGIFRVLAGVLLVFAFFSVYVGPDLFLDSANLINIGRFAAITGVMAVGMVFVLAAGEIDLSIGSVVALSAVVTGLVMERHGVVLAVLAGLGVGLAVGLVNGLITTKIGVPSFLVTLGMMEVLAGLARSVSELQAIPVPHEGFLKIFGQGDVGPIPGVCIWALGVAVVAHVLFRHAAFGREVLATGSNLAAARHSGVRTHRIKILVLVISALTASLAGILYTGRLGGARYDYGANDLLTVLAAVVIGGTSLFGGKGSIVGAVLGAIMISSLETGLILSDISPSEQMIAQGVIIILAIALSQHDRENVGALFGRWRRGRMESSEASR